MRILANATNPYLQQDGVGALLSFNEDKDWIGSIANTFVHTFAKIRRVFNATAHES